jgi:hypothetical protein
MSSTGIRMLFTTGRPLTREGSISTKGLLEQLIGSMQNLQNPNTFYPDAFVRALALAGTLKNSASRLSFASKNFIKLSNSQPLPSTSKNIFGFPIAFAYCLRYKPYKQAAPVT